MALRLGARLRLTGMPLRQASRPFLAVLLVALLMVSGAAAVLLVAGGADEGGRPPAAGESVPEDRVFATADPLERGCGLPRRYVKRILRGYHPVHSEDVTFVPLEPNFSGSFRIASHSGPWDYLQEIPLVLYGEGRIEPAGSVDRPVTLADVYPTVEGLVRIDLPPRAGEPLAEALADAPGAPKLILTVVWDGVGNETFEVHPDRWPNLARLMREGTSYTNATVGSSPSNTPATHATLGTGVYPRRHGVPSIHYRTEDRQVRSSVPQQDPTDLALTTFADEINRALDNEPKVGLLAYNTWHLTMAGKGAAAEGVGRHLLGIINYRRGGAMDSHDEYYYLPDYLRNFPGLEEHADELDRADGVADGKWMGEHDILEWHDNPAWTYFHLDATLAALEREGFGRGDVTDLFFVNFKQTDLAGHKWTVDSEEMAATLEAQDDALGRLIDYLDDRVGDYVVIVTSDHGHTRSPEVTGAWPVRQRDMIAAIEARFDVPEDEDLFATGSAYGLYFNDDVAERHGVTAAAVARFLNAYTIAENWPEEELPEAYEDRGHEHVFAAAFPTDLLPEIARCAGVSSRD